MVKREKEWGIREKNARRNGEGGKEKKEEDPARRKSSNIRVGPDIQEKLEESKSKETR